MNRGVMWGAVAFAAAYLAEQQFEHVRRDLERYDSLRAMSGKPPFLRELGGMAAGLLASLTGSNGTAPGGFVQSLVSDLVRYARIRGM